MITNLSEREKKTLENGDIVKRRILDEKGRKCGEFWLWPSGRLERRDLKGRVVETTYQDLK